MKRLTKQQRQWVWFAALWCFGVAAAASLAYAVRGVATVL